MSLPPHPPVGIDLGTTYSAIAYVEPSGRPTTIPNGLGELITATAILVEDNEIVVGSEAARASTMEPDAFADCFKRDVGSAAYRRDVRGVNLPPEILSAFVLERLKLDAEAKIGTIKDVVVTVPAFFDENRRKATQDAGRLAGLNVIDIINEPTAAALCYGYQQGFLNPDQTESDGSDDPLRVLVYDLGGGTFDVTILEISGFEFRALATDGDVQLGGRDFDERIVDYLAEQFVEEHGVDPRSDPQDAAQLWLDAQSMKHTLSQRANASTVVFHAGVRTRVDIDRETFEDLCCDLLERTKSTTCLVLKDAKLQWDDIDRVLLVGGSSRLPMVSQMLEEVTGKAVDRSTSPDEAIAHGAALYAGMIMKGDAASAIAKCNLINVNSHSLGVGGVDKSGERVNAIMIPKNTRLPARKVMLFETARPNQPNVRVMVLEGESKSPEECITLGACVIRELPPNLPKGTRVEVAYSYASNGRISISARIPEHRVSAHAEIKRDNARDLESLASWRARLFSNASADGNGQDEGATLRKLDELWVKIGQHAASLQLPPVLHKCQMNAQKKLKSYKSMKAMLSQSEAAKASASGGAAAVQTSTAVAHAKTRVENVQSQAKFACLVLGRECVNNGVSIPAVAKELERAVFLKNSIKRA